MSGSESFAARWSRLKQEAGNDPPIKSRAGDSPSDAAAAADTAAASVTGKPRPEVAEPPFDVGSLPSIDSIGAGSDIRAFLQSGVPAELTKAALRRAWTTDPAIRDFIEIAENQWDFTDPASIPGFGPLSATDDVRELVAQAMGKAKEIAALPVQDPEPSAGPPDSSTTLTSSAATTAAAQPSGMPRGTGVCSEVEQNNNADHAASQHTDQAAEPLFPGSRRSHGGALPR